MDRNTAVLLTATAVVLMIISLVPVALVVLGYVYVANPILKRYGL